MENKEYTPSIDQLQSLAEKKLDLCVTLDAESACRDADFVAVAAPINYDSKKNFFDCSAVESAIELVLKINLIHCWFRNSENAWKNSSKIVTYNQEQVDNAEETGYIRR